MVLKILVFHFIYGKSVLVTDVCDLVFQKYFVFQNVT